MAEEENKDDGILATKLGVDKIKAGEPTLGQVGGAILTYLAARKLPGAAKGLLDYQDQADEYNRYIEEQEEKRKERVRKMISDRKAKLYALVADYNFGEKMTAAHLAELEQIKQTYGSENAKLIAETYKINPTQASDNYKRILKLSEDRQSKGQGGIGGDEVAALLKVTTIPGKEAGFKDMGELMSFIESADVGTDKGFYGSIARIQSSQATQGGVAFDLGALGLSADPSRVNLQNKTLEDEIKRIADRFENTNKASNNSALRSQAADVSSALQNYSSFGKTVLYDMFGKDAVISLADSGNEILGDALRFNQDFRTYWGQTGFQLPSGNAYFKDLTLLRTKLADPSADRNKLIGFFNRTYGPNAAKRAGIN